MHEFHNVVISNSPENEFERKLMRCGEPLANGDSTQMIGISIAAIDAAEAGQTAFKANALDDLARRFRYVLLPTIWISEQTGWDAELLSQFCPGIL